MNRITNITRRNIADELLAARIWYNGRLGEPDFLSRIYDLKKMPSRDYRYTNAYDDIYQHMVMNNDWESDWVFTDTRFNLMHSSDEEYLKFLAETIHPAVRGDDNQVLHIQEIYNKHLENDGFEIIQISEISGKPIFEGRPRVFGKSHLIQKKADIEKYLNTEYVNNKINIMNEAVTNNTEIAIGTAKELIETACKSILKKHGKEASPDWNLGKLIKETSDTLDFKPKNATDPDKAETSIKQILKGITTMINGVTELRNAYGSGHGKESDFQMLESKYAKLIVGAVSEVIVFYLATDGSAELIE